MKTKTESEIRSLIQFHKRAVAGLLALMPLLPLAVRGGGVVANGTEADLRAAMAGGGLVTFACDSTITLASAITIAINTVLDGTGHQVTISGNNATRVFYVNANVNFTLMNLTIANGRVGTDGAGIRNDGGTVNATNCAFSGNVASGANAADLGSSGTGAGGGAIHNAGRLNASACTFLGNRAEGGRGADGRTLVTPLLPGGAGGQASGGAIGNLGVMTLERCLLASNSVVGGAGGRGGDYTYPSDAGTSGGQAGGALAGGLFNGGTGSVVNCTLVWNQATGGAGGTGGSRPPINFTLGTGGASGELGVGGIYSTNSLDLINCTIASNVGNGGRGGDGGYAFIPGIAGYGGLGVGGIFRGSGMTRLVNCAAALNSGVGGQGGYGCIGSGVNRYCGNFSQGGSVGNFNGTITDLGHNLSSDGSGRFTGIGSLTNTNPRLGPLANNGGPTLTMALLPGSPAIDAGDSAAAPATDQRGFPRPCGFGPDIGGYESSATTLRISRAADGGLDIRVGGTIGQVCWLLTSTNLSDWQSVASNQIGADGTVLFQDNYGTGETQRFYRVVIP